MDTYTSSRKTRVYRGRHASVGKESSVETYTHQDHGEQTGRGTTDRRRSTLERPGGRLTTWVEVSGESRSLYLGLWGGSVGVGGYQTVEVKLEE